MKIQSTVHFKQLEKSDKRISVFQGGTRSGKTHNILIWFIIKLLNEQNKILTIARKTMPSLKGSVMRDFFDILEKLKLYDVKLHNKTESIYNLNNNIVEFVSLDESLKIRGRKRNYLFLNEANEMDYESFLQLAFRTENKLVLDYNPSDEFHWIYDSVITREDADFYQSTYLNNPFLSDELIKEIERLKGQDENYWKIYGLGERGVSAVKIYSNWQIVNFVPGDLFETIYGLDFGFNNPTSLVKIKVADEGLYCQELIYESGLLNSDVISKIESLGISKTDFIYADNAEPDKIKEIFNAGYNIHPADKSVKDGIDEVKRWKLFLYESPNIEKEIKSYSWKTDRTGKVLDEPIKYNDHALDAIRYGIYTYLKVPQGFNIGTI